MGCVGKGGGLNREREERVGRRRLEDSFVFGVINHFDTVVNQLHICF